MDFVIAAQQCTVELEEHISYFMIAQTIAGVLLFLFASQLSASMFFRLGTGSAGVMLLSVLILLFLLSRYKVHEVPHIPSKCCHYSQLTCRFTTACKGSSCQTVAFRTSQLAHTAHC